MQRLPPSRRRGRSPRAAPSSSTNHVRLPTPFGRLLMLNLIPTTTPRAGPSLFPNRSQALRSPVMSVTLRYSPLMANLIALNLLASRTREEGYECH